MFEITTQESFSAAHHLRNYEGPCERIHGHNWLVTVTVRCMELDRAGVGIDFRKLRGLLHDVLAVLDHRDLNEVLEPLGISPSSEQLARHIYRMLAERLPESTVSMHRVEVCETPGNSATYME